MIYFLGTNVSCASLRWKWPHFQKMSVDSVIKTGYSATALLPRYKTFASLGGSPVAKLSWLWYWCISHVCITFGSLGSPSLRRCGARLGAVVCFVMHTATGPRLSHPGLPLLCSESAYSHKLLSGSSVKCPGCVSAKEAVISPVYIL